MTKFEEFFNTLNKTLSCYATKYIKQNYIIPSELSENIPNYTEFRVILHKLCEKLKVCCIDGFSHETMYFDYIIPTAVFLHYMHVNMDLIPEMNIYIVNEKLYNQYNPSVGGEYTTGVNSMMGNDVHVVLVKQFNKYNTLNKYETLDSLFHELMHLVDRLHIDGYKDSINYTLRWHEIKARTISNVFLEFYKGLLNEFNELESCILNQKNRIENLEYDINYQIDLTCDSIDRWQKVYDGLPKGNNLLNLSEKNTELFKSMKEINTLQKFLTNLEELI